MRIWCNTPEQLRDAFNLVREEMLEDHKPRSIFVTIPVEKRTLEQNGLLHAIFTQIRKHLFTQGIGYMEYEDEETGRMIRSPVTDEDVKDEVKRRHGIRVWVLGRLRPLSTTKYSYRQMQKFIHRIDAWAATDLDLRIVYKKRLQSIEEKYRDAT